MMWPSEARSPIDPHDRFHRVKVYLLKEDERWDHLGTGQISTKYIGRLQGVCLLVHSKSNGSLIMECKIHPDVPYRKLKRHLITWIGPNNRTVAICFRESDSCQSIWEDICEVQGKDPSAQITQEITDDLHVLQELPQIQNLREKQTCENSTLGQIAQLFNFVEESPNYKERLAILLKNEDYIKKLLQVFHICEDQQNMEGLHILYFIIREILFLNNMHLYEVMFADECIMDVLGCLEYDPVLDQPYRHREFLTENAKLKEVRPITCSKLRQTIDQTYRIQYIHDFLFPTPSKFQEHHLSDLTTFIFYNKVEIVTMLQEDKIFMFEVFAQLKDNTLGHERRRELLLFFKEFCEFANILNSLKKNILKRAIKLGLMKALKLSVQTQDYQTKEAAIDIFTHVVEYNPQIIRAYTIEEARTSKNDDDLIMNIMIKQIICDPDPESSYVLSLTAVLRTLLDPGSMRTTVDGSEKSKFINFFCMHCLDILASPILSITGRNSDDNRASISPDNYQNAQLLGVVLELLSYCVKHHTTYIRNYIVGNNLLSRVLVLMSSKHKFLVLCAIRFMRHMIALNDEVYNLYIIQQNLFEPVIKAFLRNGTQSNMLNSAIMELFEFIREENIMSLTANIAEKIFVASESVGYVQAFNDLKVYFEERKETERQMRKNLHNIIYQKISSRHMNAMEVKDEEEMCPGERTDAILPIASDFAKNYDMFIRIKDTRENEVEQSERKTSEAFDCSSSPSDASANRENEPHYSSLVPSVDYPDDDDDENDHEDHHDIDEEKEPPHKRSKLDS